MSKFVKLSREEMKNVTGGNCQWSGTCDFPDVKYNPFDQEAADDAQDVADWYCLRMDCCTDVNC